MTEGYIMALDMGTSSVKCMISDVQGKTHALVRKEIRYYSPEGLTPMAQAFSPDEVWSAIGELSRQALKIAGLEGDEIVAVGSTGQRQGVVVVDREGRELYAGPNRDIRALFEGMALDEANGEHIYSVTGHLPSFLFAPAKLKWLRNHRRELFQEACSVLPISGWLAFKLGGQTTCERAAVGEIGLLDLRARGCDPSLLECLEVDPRILPALGDAGDVVGRVTPKAAVATGLKEGTPVVLGGPDTQCGLLGMALVEEGQLGIMAGWSAPLQLVTSTPLFDQEKRTWTGCHVVPGRWVLESSATTAGDSLKWASDLLGLDFAGTIEYDDTASAEETSLGQEHVMAFLGPRVMNCSRMGLQLGGFLLPVPVNQMGIDRPHLLRAALENLAFAVKGNYLQLRQISGFKDPEVWLSGGVSEIPAFPQLVADTLNVSVQVP
ncbi:MAG: FGGY-family carbohydrate kinase, partial [Dehalococcoidia bacterium]